MDQCFCFFGDGGGFIEGRTHFGKERHALWAGHIEIMIVCFLAETDVRPCQRVTLNR